MGSAGRQELPLRIDEASGGAVIRCLCGAEAAVMRPSIVRQWQGQSDPSSAGLLRMVLHAQACLTGQNLMAEQRQAAGAR
jgi:hypothetical protein